MMNLCEKIVYLKLFNFRINKDWRSECPRCWNTMSRDWRSRYKIQLANTIWETAYKYR